MPELREREPAEDAVEAGDGRSWRVAVGGVVCCAGADVRRPGRPLRLRVGAAATWSPPGSGRLNPEAKMSARRRVLAPGRCFSSPVPATAAAADPLRAFLHPGQRPGLRFTRRAARRFAVPHPLFVELVLRECARVLSRMRMLGEAVTARVHFLRKGFHSSLARQVSAFFSSHAGVIANAMPPFHSLRSRQGRAQEDSTQR